MKELLNSETLARRDVLASLGFGAAALAGAGLGLDSIVAAQAPSSPVPTSAPITTETMGWDARVNKFILPPLPYKPDALEPHIDAQTMSLHHDKHHATYVAGLNRAIEALAEMRKKDAD